MTDREYGTYSLGDDDDKKLESLGYVPSFKREFSNLATVCDSLSNFISQSYRQSLHGRLALRLASWHVFPFHSRAYSNAILTIGSLLIRRNYIQYPVAFGGPFVSTSTNTYKHSMIPSAQPPYRLRGAGFLERPCVSPWARRSLSHVTPFTNHPMIQGHPLRKSLARSLHVVDCTYLPLLFHASRSLIMVL